MGARATRITQADFVTPPEFREFHLARTTAGRIGGVSIELLHQRDETQLGFCYQQIPVHLMPPFWLDDETALLYLINLTAGLMDGDGHAIRVDAHAGTRAVITGQSATRVHPALVSFATQQWTVDVSEGATLVVLPGPTIPYRGCRYYQRGRVSLAPDARLLWGDIWLAGRYDRGELSERYVFDRIVQDFEVRRAGQLSYRDRFSWKGPWKPHDVTWYFGGQLACASLYIAGPLPEELAAAPATVRRAVFRLDTGDACIRWCGHPSVVTADLVGTALSLAAFWDKGPGAAPWLLSSHALSPNHWFSTAWCGSE